MKVLDRSRLALCRDIIRLVMETALQVCCIHSGESLGNGECDDQVEAPGVEEISVRFPPRGIQLSGRV